MSTARDAWRLARRRPVAVRALNAAVAAALAWAAVTALGTLTDVADRYPYYAPLGAVIAVSGSVVGSVRDSVRCVVAIAAGAVVATAVSLLGLPDVAGLAVVVGVGTLVGGWSWFGTQGSWVPVSSIFVLVIGNTDPERYAAAYAGLTALGALVGIAVNLVVPPLPLTSSGGALARLRDAIAEQLDDLADALRQEQAPSEEEWASRRHGVESVARHVATTLQEATEARRVNWRARRWQRTTEQQYRFAASLDELVSLVEHLNDLLGTGELADHDHVPLGPALRPPTADVLSALCDVLRSTGTPVPRRRQRREVPLGPDVDAEAVRRTDAAVRVLVERIRDERSRSEDDFFAAGAVVTVVRQALWGLTDPDLAVDYPSRY